MSNRQLGWDDRRVRNRISPREIDEMDKEQFNEEKAQEEPADNKDRVLDSNPNTHSKKSNG